MLFILLFAKNVLIQFMYIKNICNIFMKVTFKYSKSDICIFHLYYDLSPNKIVYVSLSHVYQSTWNHRSR